MNLFIKNYVEAFPRPRAVRLVYPVWDIMEGVAGVSQLQIKPHTLSLPFPLSPPLSPLPSLHLFLSPSLSPPLPLYLSPSLPPSLLLWGADNIKCLGVLLVAFAWSITAVLSCSSKCYPLPQLLLRLFMEWCNHNCLVAYCLYNKAPATTIQQP